MDELQMISEMLPEQPGPDRQVVASARARMTAPGTTGAGTPGLGGRPAQRPHRRGLLAAGVAAAAAAAAAAVLAASGQGIASRPGHPGGGAQVTFTARQILLTAAAHVAAAPVTGKYWRVREISGSTAPAGTKADPYDISMQFAYDQWASRPPGRRDWNIYRALAALPATPADAAAWRAAGSPTSWTYKLRTFTTTAGSPPGATWQISDGTVGYIEGNLAGLTPAQFLALPGDHALLLAALRHYARKTCAGQPGCTTVDQMVWAQAVNLLQDPVTSRVRAAAYRVMAGLPGVRLLGAMRDPLGRTGYGLSTGHGNDGSVAIIDPKTGSLLATEILGPVDLRGPGYYGRSYQGQLNGYEVLESDGWTNASPVLPPRSAWVGPQGQQG